MKSLEVSLLVTLAVITSLPIAPKLCAQEEPAAMYLKEEPKEEEGQGIQTGYVVAYGEKIPPPYFVTNSGDTIKINGIQMRPPLKDPNEPKVVSPFEKLSPEQRELVSRIEDTYGNYLDELGEKQAQERLTSEFENNPLISKLEFSSDGVFLHIDFPDGKRWPTVVKSEQWFLSPLPPGVVRDRQKEINEQIEGVKSDLRMGMMIIFGCGGPEITCGPKIAEQIISIVMQVKQRELTSPEGEQRIVHILNNNKRARDIIEKVATW